MDGALTPEYLYASPIDGSTRMPSYALTLVGVMTVVSALMATTLVLFSASAFSLATYTAGIAVGLVIVYYVISLYRR